MSSDPSVDVARFRVRPGASVLLEEQAAQPQCEEAEGGGTPQATLAQLDDCVSAHRSRGYGLLVVLQGMDASGKDGVVAELSGLPAFSAGVRTVRFRRPDAEEAGHDFLWRVHRAVPARGEVVFFHRSHYEDVLVPAVDGLLEQEVIESRFAHIRAFERLLVDEGITVVKLFLNISREVQRLKLEGRAARDDRRHNPEDLVRARRWDDYIRGYAAVLRATSTEHAPWYVISADHRRTRNALVAGALVAELSRVRRGAGWSASHGARPGQGVGE